ncbi:MAG: VTT domain-containing protein [Cyclobacteriaceae bacterium]|jgi:membrane-associated protein|nr:VTT domain-containing protein [Cyclobacteriaceae bacterium]
MQEKLLLFLDFLNPEELIRYGGFTLLILIIFAETGVFFGFFLPGDSLLFIAGLLSESEYLEVHVSLMIPVLIVAAVAGSTTGYFTGLWAGNYLKNRKENFFFKKKYLDMTHEFYERHGMMAFILGRFLPVIRTFVTILAGTVKINFPKFFIYNIVGASLWITSMVMAGNLLGKAFPDLPDYLEIIVIVMVLVSAVPVALTWWRAKRRMRQMDADKDK